MSNFAHIHSRFGTNKAIAEALGVEQVMVAIWKRRGNIPHTHWAALARLGEERGLDGLSLEELHEVSVQPQAIVSESENAA